MGKSTHFLGQPLLCELTKFINKHEVLRFSRETGGERYIKTFDAWQHLVVMLYAVISRFDSLREIMKTIELESRKLSHLGVDTLPRRSTLSDANARRPEAIFERVYRSLYARRHALLSPDSRSGGVPKWLRKLHIIDSTTISLFSNLIFKGCGRHPKTGKKKGGIKAHTVICANEGVPCDVRFTSAATHDAFMLVPANVPRGSLLAFDRAYIDYAKMEALTERGIVYVTKMKKGLKYDVKADCMDMSTDGRMAYREQVVVFRKGETAHIARIITHVDTKGKTPKLVRLLTNDFDLPMGEIVEIYRKRWAIELLFKQIKQNFPLRYFYGESANAIKIQIWVTLIANLLIMLLKAGIRHPWSFSNLATVVRVLLLSYLNPYTLLEHPEADWNKIAEAQESPPQEPSLFD